MDIFCDAVGEETYQSFPFLRDSQGQRTIILRFHLDEAITARTPEEARIRCVRRLEDFFDQEDQAVQGPA